MAKKRPRRRDKTWKTKNRNAIPSSETTLLKKTRDRLQVPREQKKATLPRKIHSVIGAKKKNSATINGITNLRKEKKHDRVSVAISELGKIGSQTRLIRAKKPRYESQLNYKSSKGKSCATVQSKRSWMIFDKHGRLRSINKPSDCSEKRFANLITDKTRFEVKTFYGATSSSLIQRKLGQKSVVTSER